MSQNRSSAASDGLFAAMADSVKGKSAATPPISWPFDGLSMASYRTILADPPWRFHNFSEAGEEKNPVAHYPCMEMSDMLALPVSQLAAPDAALVMWCIWPMAPEAVTLMQAWGFAVKSGGAWAKQSSTGAKWAFGTGYLYRSASEFWLLGTRGAPRIKSRSVRNLIAAPVREHSRKPDQMHCDLEALFDGPRCELFARQSRPGWDSWGNEVDKFEGDAL